MILPKNMISRIEGLLEKGHTVELRVEEIPTQKGSKPLPPQVTIFKRPDDDNDIPFNPTLIDQDNRTQLYIYAVNAGEDPILLASPIVPAGFNLAGLKGYGGISQEMDDKS